MFARQALSPTQTQHQKLVILSQRANISCQAAGRKARRPKEWRRLVPAIVFDIFPSFSLPSPSSSPSLPHFLPLPVYTGDMASARIALRRLSAPAGVTVSTLLPALEAHQKAAAEAVVPWLLAAMPSSYFRYVPAALQQDHLRAIAALYGSGTAPQLTLTSSDKLSLTFIRPGNFPGMLRYVSDVIISRLTSGVVLTSAHTHTHREREREKSCTARTREKKGEDGNGALCALACSHVFPLKGRMEFRRN